MGPLTVLNERIDNSLIIVDIFALTLDISQLEILLITRDDTQKPHVQHSQMNLLISRSSL